MKKFILKLDLHDDKDKRKALKIVSSLQGIDSIAMDMKEKKLTVIGTVDPIPIVSKLRKFWNANIITVGPAKEPEKKEEPKKEEPKKEEAKKDEPKKEEEAKKEGGEPKKEGEAKKEEEGKKEEPKKEEPKKDVEVKKKEPEMITGFIPYHRPYYPPPPPPPYYQYQYNYMQQQHNQRPQYPPANTHYYLHQNAEENPNTCVVS